jgi:predicted KAP-like P-loop ATPase
MLELMNPFQIRRLAIKELPSFCKDSKENTPKISDILAQLLNASDASEVQQVNLSLQTLSKVNIPPKARRE